MEPAPSDSPASRFQVRGARSSSVIIHRVAPGNTGAFLEWQHGITRAAEDFPGYQETEVYPPTAEHPQQWVIVIHFDSAHGLQSWLNSPQRAEWTANLPDEIREFRLTTLPSGFSSWFAGLAEAGEPLPHWKVFLMVLVGLYPTIMVLSLCLSPHTQRFGPAVAILIGNVASCAFLEWLGSPVIRLFLGPWLRARGKEGRLCNLIGSALIVGSLVAMTVLFHFLSDSGQ